MSDEFNEDLQDQWAARRETERADELRAAVKKAIQDFVEYIVDDGGYVTCWVAVADVTSIALDRSNTTLPMHITDNDGSMSWKLGLLEQAAGAFRIY